MAFEFAALDEFVNRVDDLAAMERWWSSQDRNALNLYGRRRVGKSWLFRRFAHGKPATILVAERLAPGSQLKRLAGQLESAFGVRPQIDDVGELFRLLYALGEEEKQLVVLDEFPYLLPRAEEARDALLTTIQAVMEEGRDSSNTKLILCGSSVTQMQALMSEGSALRGRLTSLNIAPMTIVEAGALIEDEDAVNRIERFAVTGGMARYLAELGSGGPLKQRVCEHLLDPRGALFNDPREVLEQELEQVAMYFSVLQELSSGPKSLGEIASALGVARTNLPRPIGVLQEMDLVSRRTPINADRDSRDSRYSIADPFLRFWFRFVFPYQEDLASGLATGSLYDLEIAPQLADHTAPLFEALCRVWVRANRGQKASRVASWWGLTTKAGVERGRSSEEVDIVGMARGRASVLGECKWTTSRLSVSILADLEQFKIPAMRQGGIKLASNVETILFSKAGFTDGLIEAAEKDPNLTLITADQVLAGL